MSKLNKSSNGKSRVYLGRKAWEKHVSDFHHSGLTQPEYAKQHQLNLTTFRNWITKLKREAQSSPETSSAFIPMKVSNNTLSKQPTSSKAADSGLHIRLPNGIECTFPPNHAPGLILPWIEYLRVLP